jgi:AbrB family looped-hinge helix DNA binding protein
MSVNVVRMDKVGRVTLPKAVREQLGLQPGDSLEVKLLPAGLELRPMKAGLRLEAVDGLLVLKGCSQMGAEVDLTAKHREARVRALKRRTVRKA